MLHIFDTTGGLFSTDPPGELFFIHIGTRHVQFVAKNNKFSI